MDDLGRTGDRRKEEFGDSPEEEMNADDERCVETGRNLINSLLEDSEAQFPVRSSLDEDGQPMIKVDDDEVRLEDKINVGEIFSVASSPLEPFVVAMEDEHESFEFVSQGVNAVDLLEELPEEETCPSEPGPSTSYDDLVVEEEADILEVLREQPGHTTSYEDLVAQERTLKMLTDLWIRENCVASQYSSIPRDEIYAVYVDDMRNNCISVAVSQEMFLLYLCDVFPSVYLGTMNANGIRLNVPHRLAPSSFHWKMMPIVISNVDLLKGEAVGSPIEQVTTLWMQQNCVADSDATTPRQEFYAIYINELRKKNRAFNGSLFLFESVLKKLFPAVQIRTTQLMVFIKGVKFVGQQTIVRALIGENRKHKNGAVPEGFVEAMPWMFKDSSLPVLSQPERIDVHISGNELRNDEAPPVLVDAVTNEVNGSGGCGVATVCDSEPGFSGGVQKQWDGDDLTEAEELPLFSEFKTEEPIDFNENGPEIHPKEEPPDNEDDPQPVLTSIKLPPSYPYKCPVCCKGFRDPFKYALHMREYKKGVVGPDQDLGPNIFIDTDPNNKKKHICGICNKAFAIFRDLTVHYRTHTGEKPFECGVCQKKFSDKRRLKHHEHIHSGVKRFQCDKCDKSFNWASDFKLHYQNHNGEKPYACDQCPKAFGTSAHLSRHKLSHSGEKKFVCEHCEKAFLLNYDLKNHIRTHTGESKYRCEHCNRGFAIKSRWQKHLAKHTDEKSS